MPDRAPSDPLARVSFLSLLCATFFFVAPYVAARFEIGLAVQPVAVLAWGLAATALLVSLIIGTLVFRRRRVVLFWVVPLWLAVLLALVQTCVGW